MDAYDFNQPMTSSTRLLESFDAAIHQCPETPGYPRTVGPPEVSWPWPFRLGARDNTVSYFVGRDWRVVGGWYGGPGNPTTVENMYLDRPAKLVKITDGLSRAVMMFEQSGVPLTYTNGRPTEQLFALSWENWFCCENRPVLERLNVNFRNSREIYSFHSAGVNMSRFDGSVEFVNEDIDEMVLLRILGRSDDDQRSSN